MPIKERIAEDLKSFMRAKDTYALEVIRLLKADIKNTEIDAKRELDDDGVIKAVKSLMKKHTEALDISKSAGRSDLVAKEEKYLEVLKEYLPAQLDEGALRRIIEETIKELGSPEPKKAFGAIMKAVLAKAGAAADGKIVSGLIKEALG